MTIKRTLSTVGSFGLLVAMIAPGSALAQTQVPIAVDPTVTTPPTQPTQQPPANPQDPRLQLLQTPPPSGPQPLQSPQPEPPMVIQPQVQQQIPVQVPPGQTMYINVNGQLVPYTGNPAVAPVAPGGYQVVIQQPGNYQGYVTVPAPVQRRTPRLVVNVEAGVVGFTQSEFNQAAALWGYSGFRWGYQLSLMGGYHIHPAVMFGARIGWANASGGSASFDGATMTLNQFNFGGVVRLGYPIPMGPTGYLFPGVELEGGFSLANIGLRGQISSRALPRFASSALLTIAGRYVGVSFRLGYQYTLWPDLGSGGEDLALSGFQGGISLEFVP